MSLPTRISVRARDCGRDCKSVQSITRLDNRSLERPSDCESVQMIARVFNWLLERPTFQLIEGRESAQKRW